MTTYTIYCITNRINGKRYIGFTKNSVQIRWKQHIDDAKNNSLCHFHAAIRKWGIDVWELEELETGIHELDVKRYEVAFISLLDTFYSGYNSTQGGDGILGYHHSDDVRRVISQSGIGRNHSIETRQQMSKSHVGLQPSIATRNKMSKSASSRKRQGNPKSVQQWSLSGQLIQTFATVKSAAKALKVDVGQIRASCNGKKQFVAGFVWRWNK